MTNHWVDIKNADLIIVMGGNAAEAHPCGFKWVTEAKANRGAKLIVVDPRFTRSAAVSDYYAPIRVGTDIAFLAGVINYLLTNDKIQHEYVRHYTNAPFIVKDEYQFEDGLFSGYDEDDRRYDRASWGYEMRDDGFARVDYSLRHPRCVFQLMKTHFSRYTPELVSRITGTPEDRFLHICEAIAEHSAPDKVMTILYALGWTQHSKGSQNIRTMAMIQLLLGNIGMPGGGVNALRGHANVQGITDMNLVTTNLPGYLNLPNDQHQDFGEYMELKALKPIRPDQISWWQHYPKYHVSLMKAWYGDAASADNDFAYDYLPKIDRPYDVMQMFELMHTDQMNGFICQGFNPVAAVSHKAKMTQALSKLKYLVIIDPLVTETSEFWRNFGSYNDVDPSQIQTEVFRLPSGLFAEEDGTFTNSGRVIIWKEKGANPPGEAKPDREIIARLFLKIREMYQAEGGAFPDPILNVSWPYNNPEVPDSGELLREISGKAVADVRDADGRITIPAGQQVAGFAQLRDDGSTACGNWLYSGAWTATGNMAARRSTADPSGLGVYPEWGFAWPANRRILYNRASCDMDGRPWDPRRAPVAWDGQRWSGPDIPDMRPNAAPEEEVMPFIMTPEGTARLFAGMNEGPFPEHYEPFESPLGYNPLHRDNLKATNNPAARVFAQDWASFGDADEFPYAATTYRLTEHFHFWTKHAQSAAVTQPSQFVEIGEALAQEKGIRSGDDVVVMSNRGEITATCVVTKRIKPLNVDGKVVHTVGIPIHWGFAGLTNRGYLANVLTPYVGDANSQTPEFKAFLVDIEKA
ncbi:Formate dehydrogenase O alpha subunit; selenocysteine-containing [Thioalkalivibrio nitratireducens DSM 14787]|uniref:Formate dehydrogenase O alpha subunit selenocysteine-containing n=3 Tax=Thioalkalivibrio nitratireducens TaxID=186931 RepID=L0DUG3_THIND|nr:Formate dehydrogenase O alpha subunit; selenocysteine-containing [Thioalkalivibrio nitratireducens DSM 14787]